MFLLLVPFSLEMCINYAFCWWVIFHTCWGLKDKNNTNVLNLIKHSMWILLMNTFAPRSFSVSQSIALRIVKTCGRLHYNNSSFYSNNELSCEYNMNTFLVWCCLRHIWVLGNGVKHSGLERFPRSGQIQTLSFSNRLNLWDFVVISPSVLPSVFLYWSRGWMVGIVTAHLTLFSSMCLLLISKCTNPYRQPWIYPQPVCLKLQCFLSPALSYSLSSLILSSHCGELVGNKLFPAIPSGLPLNNSVQAKL